MRPGDLVSINIDFWYGFSKFPGHEFLNSDCSLGICIRSPYKKFKQMMPGLTEEETVLDVYVCGKVFCIPKSYITRFSYVGVK